MKKSGLFSLLIICMFATTLTACEKKDEVVNVEVQTEEVNMFGLTDEEQKLYAEYAAGVLMKYNAGTNNRVLEGQKLIQQEAKEEAQREQAAKREQLVAEYEANKSSNNKEKENSSSGGSASSGSGISYISDMAQATGMEAFSIVYDGYEVTDSYPNSGDDVLMAMDATNGKVLMVTKFKVTNVSGQTEHLNMFSKQAKFKLNLNGKRYNAQYTLLLDDLSMYKGDLEAGENVEGVLIFEIPESEASNVEDMVLSITVDGESSSMQLRGGSSVMWTESVEEADSEENTAIEQENIIGEDEEASSEEVNQKENDLAQEYMEALKALESGSVYENSDSSDGNVTVVGSKKN